MRMGQDSQGRQAVKKGPSGNCVKKSTLLRPIFKKAPRNYNDGRWLIGCVFEFSLITMRTTIFFH